MPTTTGLAGEQLLTAQEVADLLKVSRRTVWRWLAQGRLPPPIRCSQRCPRWKASVLRAYLEELSNIAR
jgi:predicted DNA-binding transcriptional regulator AlpA